MTEPETQDEGPTCPICHDLGWLLTGDPASRPLVLDLAACPGPECPSAATPLEVLAVGGQFSRAVLHPGTRAVMSLVGARARTVDLPQVPHHTTPTRVPPRSGLPPGARTTRPGGAT